MNSRKGNFRKVVEWLHLWLGLFSGIVVVVVCLTASIWAFRPDIERLTLGHLFSDDQAIPTLKIGEVRQAADAVIDSLSDGEYTLAQIFYGKIGRTIAVDYSNRSGAPASVYLHPANGKIVKIETGPSKTLKFMLFLRAGHRFFWLPPQYGSPFVGGCCILFIFTLLTGIIWWYPKKWTRSTREKSFRIKWTAKWKRINIDLHNVLGFYTLLVALVLSVTGIYYSFDWFKKGYHALLTGKGTVPIVYPYEIAAPSSDRELDVGLPIDSIEGIIWQRLDCLVGNNEISVSYPAEDTSTFQVYINPLETRQGYYHKMYSRYFDRYSGEERFPRFPQTAFADLSLGEKFYRTNYEIHVGAIGGISTRIIASFASLVSASLPITGFIIWYNRKWGRKPKGKKQR